jgi:hypothetical protein
LRAFLLKAGFCALFLKSAGALVIAIVHTIKSIRVIYKISSRIFQKVFLT